MTTSFDFEPKRNKPASPPTRPVQAVPVSYLSSWLYFLLILCLLVAWYFPVKILVSYLMWPPTEEHEVRDSYAFVALAYEGVSRRDHEIQPAQFREHIDTLKEHGYVPITLEDVRGLMLRNEPLPPRAVLTTFDHGRRTSYFLTKAHMRRTGWRGVMFLWTRPIEERDTASLLWPYVRSMIRLPTWEIGAQSHHGFDPVTAHASGRTGRFMTTPRWLPAEDRFEQPDEFIARVEADHTFQQKLIERRTGTRPIAYAYPYGDFGQFRTRAEFIRHINLAQVEHFYDLGFVSGNLPVNTRYSDPRRLNRLRVRPEWSGEELVAYLERSWPQEALAVDLREGQSPAAWIVDWGSMQMDDNRVSLRAAEGTTGAKMWLAGSDLGRDFYSRIDFRIWHGQMGLYLRASPDEESYVYLGIDARGEAWVREKQHGREAERWDDEREGDLSVWLRQKQPARQRFTLASAQTRMEPRDVHTVEVFVRDRMLYALLNGRPLFEGHINIRGDVRPGMFGISVWSPEQGRARVDVTGLTLRSQQPTLALWGEQRGYSPHTVRWLHDNAYNITQISPPWISFSPVGQQIRHHWDQAILDRIARIYGLDVVPRVRIEQQQWLSYLPPTMLADMAEDRGFNQVFVNMERMADATPTQVTPWLQQSVSALRERGIEMLVQLPEALEQAATINSILAVIPGLPIAVAEGSPRREQATVQVARMPTNTADDGEVPLFYQIMDLQEDTARQTRQGRIRSLEDLGMAAFREGDYPQAIDRWSEWKGMDPGNPRPLMLLGDAYLRIQDAPQAIEFYNRSLEKDPGQVSLALRRARIMQQHGMTAEAIETLNLYARLFPDNPNIVLAQAELVHAEAGPDKARELAERVLARHPGNLDALTMLVRWSDTPDERMRYLSRMAQASLTSAQAHALGDMIWRHDLLSVPEAYALRRRVEQVYQETTDDRVRQLYAKLRLPEPTVTEDFSAGDLSGHWWLQGGRATAADDHLQLQPDTGRTEVSLRLLGSERLRDAFVETTLDDWNGSFWLYARRTADQMVRFGFEDTPDQIYLQVWRDGRTVVNESRWVDVPNNEPLALRLELRGDGMMGYVNGQPLFDSAIPLPSGLWLGWVGLSAFDQERGQARANLSRLSAGTLPLRVAMLPQQSTAHDLDELLEALRPHTRQLTDLAPRFFTIRSNGDWVAHQEEQHRLVRLFARFNRLRIVPAIAVQSTDATALNGLRSRLLEQRFDGAILVMDELPAEDWLEALREEINLAPLDVHLLVRDESGQALDSYPLGAAVDLYHGDPDTWSLPRLSGSLRDPGFRRSVEEWPRHDPLVLEL